MTRYAAFVAKATALRPVLGGPDQPYKVVPSDPALAGMTQVFETQFDKLDTTKFHVYDSTQFSSAANQHQAYMAANALTGKIGSTGSTNGTSLKLLTKRENVTLGTTTVGFSAGMLDTKTAGFYAPRYGRIEFRCKTPHGQGLWPSIWGTAKSGGATMCEFDILEYFHAQLPGRNSSTLHGTDNTGKFLANRYTNNGATGASPRTFFEAPTYTPGWHTWAGEIIPVTDSTGVTPADVTKPSPYVRFRVYLDGKQVVQWIDTSANYWTTNGGDADAFWNIYLQGCQVGGNYIGEIDGNLGYSTSRNACLISGTAPNSCSITSGGYTVQRAQLADPASTLEVDYLRFYKYTG